MNLRWRERNDRDSTYRRKYGTDRILSLIVFSYTVYVCTYILRAHISCAYFRQCSMILTYYIPHAQHTRDTQAYMVNTTYHTMKSSIRYAHRRKISTCMRQSLYIYVYTHRSTTNFYITYSPAMLVLFVIYTHISARAHIQCDLNSYEVINIFRIYFSCDFVEYRNYVSSRGNKKKRKKKRRENLLVNVTRTFCNEVKFCQAFSFHSFNLFTIFESQSRFFQIDIRLDGNETRSIFDPIYSRNIQSHQKLVLPICRKLWYFLRLESTQKGKNSYVLEKEKGGSINFEEKLIILSQRETFQINQVNPSIG